VPKPSIVWKSRPARPAAAAHGVLTGPGAAPRARRPDAAALRRIETRGVMVTSRATGGYDVVSRFFAPRLGLDEDWVTGSAHCCLGPYWAARLGKEALLAHQASARGGTVRVRVDGERVHLAGRAVTVARGELLVGAPA
jgi:predicted PhzF superfamily epimerase YddE/YHI9